MDILMYKDPYFSTLVVISIFNFQAYPKFLSPSWILKWFHHCNKKEFVVSMKPLIPLPLGITKVGLIFCTLFLIFFPLAYDSLDISASFITWFKFYYFRPSSLSSLIFSSFYLSPLWATFSWICWKNITFRSWIGYTWLREKIL